VPSIVSKTRIDASRIGVWVFGVMLVACSKDALAPNANAVESVIVAPATATVAVGAALSLSAEVLDAEGNVVDGQRVSWATEDATIADVSAAGVVTGRKVGTVLIAASARGKDAFARITVNPTPVATIRLSPTHRSMQIGQSAQLIAEPLDAGGGVLAGRQVTWSSSDATVATVTNDGQVTALAAGAAIITATSEGKSAVASITVSQVPVAAILVTPGVNDLVAGQTSRLTAQLRDASGALLTGRVIAWSTNRSTVATVTSDGLVTAVATGTATISATSEGKTGSATVNVTPRPVSAVIVSPNQVTIYAGQTVQLSALVTDDRGQVLSGRPITFSSSRTQVATVSALGVVTGVSAGTATITAVSESASGTATITIAPDPVAAVDVTPSSSSISVWSTVQLVAVPRNVNGQVLTGRTVTWSSGTPALASVSATGLVTGLAAGDAVIIATVDGKQGAATVTVRQVPVASVSVTPATASTTVGQTVTLSATTFDASGNLLTGRVVGWSSSDNTIATVSVTGVVTGVASGNVIITASSEGQSGTATVAVGQVPVASVTVSPSTATTSVGQTVSLAATTFDAGGNLLTGRIVTWTSSNASIASVSGTGVVTGVATGNATITATSENQSGSAVITVNSAAPAQAASVTVSPSTANVNVGASSTLTATARDASGNVIVGAPIAWSSSDGSVATVSSGGVVTGVAPGNATITATSGSATGTASIAVQLTPVHRIVVTPANPTIDEDETIQLTATLYDSQNNVLTGRTVTWSSSNTGRVTVSSTGLAYGVRDGSATITASSGGKSGSTTVKVDD